MLFDKADYLIIEDKLLTVDDCSLHDLCCILCVCHCVAVKKEINFKTKGIMNE